MVTRSQEEIIRQSIMDINKYVRCLHMSKRSLQPANNTGNWEVIKDVRSHRAKVGTFFAMKVGRRSKGEGCSRQRARRDLRRRNFQFTKAGKNQDESTF